MKKNRHAWLLTAALALLLAGCGGMKTRPPAMPGAEPGAIPPTATTPPAGQASPAGQTPAPAGQPPAPAGQMPAPAGQPPAPAGQPPAPAGQPPALAGQIPAPGEQPPPPPAELTPQAAAEAAVAELGPRPPVSENRAVLALLGKALADGAAGQRESAEASLERALRIEPRNPWLWHELAGLRLRQGDYAQAITLARKSTSFAGGKHRVQAENWQVIGLARIAQGDSAGADQAFRQAAELAKQAKGE